jgi:hypothetical protein
VPDPQALRRRFVIVGLSLFRSDGRHRDCACCIGSSALFQRGGRRWGDLGADGDILTDRKNLIHFLD